MVNKYLTVGLLPLLISMSAWAKDPADAGNLTPTNTPETITISTAIDASCFATTAAKALVAIESKEWERFGYKSATDWFAAALSHAVAGLSFNAQFNVTHAPNGEADQLDFKTNLAGGNLAFAATATATSATVYAPTWERDWKKERRRHKEITWVSDDAKPKKGGFGAKSNDSLSSAANASGFNAIGAIFVSGRQIDEFRNHLTFNAWSWSGVTSSSYATLFSSIALNNGWNISPRFAAAAGKALATAVAQTNALLDMDVHYKAQDGHVVIDDTKVTLACGSGSSVTAEAFSSP